MSLRRQQRNAQRRTIRFWCEGTSMVKVFSKGRPGLIRRWQLWNAGFISQLSYDLDRQGINGTKVFLHGIDQSGQPLVIEGVASFEEVEKPDPDGEEVSIWRSEPRIESL